MDAIRTLGLDPIDLLVLPRVLALLVMLPLLTFIAMLAGLLGGLSVGAFNLDIPPQAYFARMEATIEVRHFLVGMAKAPLFALVIALIGCLEGLQVEGTAHRRRTHHLQRGAGDLAGDRARRDHGDLVHADGRLMATTDTPIIRVRGLANRFGEQVVHEGLDLDVRRGEILGVVGGSGTGKSVLMRSILGLREPDAGQIEVLGVDARDDDPELRLHIQRNTGVLFQDGALFSSLTVGENVQVPLKEHHPDLPDTLRYELALLKVKLAGLPADALNKLPSQLSGACASAPGWRAGAGSAAAVPGRATAGLDPIGAAAFDELIRTLQRALGLTVFLITHDLDTLYTICDRVAVLADRKLVINAPIAEVERCPAPWVQEYFHGPRARAARNARPLPA